MNNKLKLLIGGAATFLVVGGATAAGLAYANPTPAPGAPTPASPSASAGPQTQQQKQAKQNGGKRGEKLLGRALHGEATVKGGKKTGGKTQDVVFQRGSVTAVSATSVAVKSEDGFSATYAIDGAVLVRTGGQGQAQRGTMADVTTGATVRIFGVKSGDTVTVKRVIVQP